MSNLFFISDLHFGHKRIMDFEGANRDGEDWYENMHILCALWDSVVTKRDTVWVLGDVAFSQEGLAALRELNGNKKLILGNHDKFTLNEYRTVFSSIHGFVKKYDYWLSHAPIHPYELRGRKNIHGHVHSQSMMNGYTGEPDPRYINVCVENVNGTPISLDQIRDKYEKQI